MSASPNAKTARRGARPGRLALALFKRFRRNRRGSVAIEFAMLSIPFIALIYAIFQTSMVHITGQVLQTAVSDASRLIMTGQAQAGGFDETRFRTEICSRVKGMFDCQSMLKLDVRTASSFSSADLSRPPVNAGNLDTTSFTYAPGGARTVNIVRAVIAYPIILPLIGPSFVNLNGNKLLIMATAAFQTEPFN